MIRENGMGRQASRPYSGHNEVIDVYVSYDGKFAYVAHIRTRSHRMAAEAGIADRRLPEAYRQNTEICQAERAEYCEKKGRKGGVAVQTVLVDTDPLTGRKEKQNKFWLPDPARTKPRGPERNYDPGFAEHKKHV